MEEETVIVERSITVKSQESQVKFETNRGKKRTERERKIKAEKERKRKQKKKIHRLHKTKAKPSSKEMMAEISCTWLGSSTVAVAWTGDVRGSLYVERVASPYAPLIWYSVLPCTNEDTTCC